MDDLLQSLAEHPEVTVSIAMGIEHWKTGLTTLTVRGDGEARVLNLRAGKETEHVQNLPVQRVQEFGAALSQAGFSSLPPSAQTGRQPGDLPIHLMLQQGETTLMEQRVWHGDRYTEARVNSIIMLYEKLVSEITNAALPYGTPAKKNQGWRFWRRDTD